MKTINISYLLIIDYFKIIFYFEARSLRCAKPQPDIPYLSSLLKYELFNTNWFQSEKTNINQTSFADIFNILLLK